MHKDKPPGIFDFAERSIGHLVGICFGAGFLLSIFVHVGMSVWRDNAKEETGLRDQAELESATAGVRKATPPPTAPAVKY
jgi:hypothetical protein